MRTFQIDSEPKRLYFANYNRIEEEILFQNILAKLESCKEIEIGRKQIGPSEDLYKCKWSDLSFCLVYDIDYGTYIQADDEKVIQRLEKFFEEGRLAMDDK
ncbi:MAG: hypothetical protein MR594_02125 [Lachnospiraceae bacterium]|nr:hypothetical protein [Lachnospiraceae bacterium]